MKNMRWMGLAALLLWAVSGKVQGQDTQKIILYLVDETEYEMEWDADRTPELPLYRTNAEGLREKMGKSEVLSIRLADESRPIKGYTHWEVRKVAAPSLLLGNRNTETRLIGVKAESDSATIYGWIGDGTDDRPGDVWYGVRLADSDVVYPFVQDNVVWLRDMRMVLGRTYPEFVDMVMNYYCKGKKSQQNKRQKDLRTKPYTLLTLIETGGESAGETE